MTEKFRVFIVSSCFQFSAENILWLFKNRSRRARVDQDDTKFVFCIKKLFFGVYYTLNDATLKFF